MTIYFTSDMHLGHKNIIKYSNRPFNSLVEMDQVIIDNYNSVVKKGDTVYDLGDFCFTNPKKYVDRFNVPSIRLKRSMIWAISVSLIQTVIWTASTFHLFVSRVATTTT